MANTPIPARAAGLSTPKRRKTYGVQPNASVRDAKPGVYKPAGSSPPPKPGVYKPAGSSPPPKRPAGLGVVPKKRPADLGMTKAEGDAVQKNIDTAVDYYKKGGMVEGSAKDTREDKAMAKKRGMSMAQWEKSGADKKHDAPKKMATGGSVRGTGCAIRGKGFSGTY